MIFPTLITINILLILILHNLSFKINLIDYPTQRKKHNGEIPLVGGIAIYLTILIGISLIDLDIYLKLFIYTSSIVVLIGILDDILNIDFKIRFFCQFLASLIIVANGIYINNISILNISEYNYLIYFFIPFTVLATVGLTNAFNFVDGIDGLSSSLFLKSMLILMFLIYINDPSFNFDIFLIILSTIIPFLIFNLGLFKNYKIFLGDSGSTFLGFILFEKISLNLLSEKNKLPKKMIYNLCLKLK